MGAVTILHPAERAVAARGLTCIQIAGRRSPAPVSLLLVLLVTMFFSGCGGGSGNAGDPFVRSAVSKISVLPATSSIQIGSTEQLQAMAKDQDGNVVSGTTFAFSGSNSVATVSGTGLVKGVSAGTATITISAGGMSASISITVVPVTPVVTQVSVSPSTASIHAGQTQSYTAVAYDQFNKPMSGVNFI